MARILWVLKTRVQNPCSMFRFMQAGYQGLGWLEDYLYETKVGENS